MIGIGTDGPARYLILRWLAQGASTETTQSIPQADIGERECWCKLKAGGVMVARILIESGMLKKRIHGKGWQIKTPRLKHLNNAHPRTYVLLFAPKLAEEKTH
ncbi:hypothetical protein RVY14_004655 [Enterobacter cloacae]|nr:hypothetical protein [Enterobacter cloacae]ELK7550488.1 hypothetical protein [Enterobacter cloacae]